MKARLTKINENEVLKYLGYSGESLQDSLLLDIKRISDEVLSISAPMLTYKFFSIEKEPSFHLDKTNFIPSGENIKNMLSDSENCVVVAATLGMQVEKELRKKQLLTVYDSLIMDCCASSAVENICNNFCEDLAESLKKDGLYLTDRYSPGYGDFPLFQQKDICNLLSTAKTIGVSLNSTGIMIPRKSVTAIIGISKNPQKKHFRGCENCNMFKSCKMRKGNISCEKFP